MTKKIKTKELTCSINPEITLSVPQPLLYANRNKQGRWRVNSDLGLKMLDVYLTTYNIDITEVKQAGYTAKYMPLQVARQCVIAILEHEGYQTIVKPKRKTVAKGFTKLAIQYQKEIENTMRMKKKTALQIDKKHHKEMMSKLYTFADDMDTALIRPLSFEPLDLHEWFTRTGKFSQLEPMASFNVVSKYRLVVLKFIYYGQVLKLIATNGLDVYKVISPPPSKDVDRKRMGHQMFKEIYNKALELDKEWLADVCLIAACTSMRREDICRAEWDDINFDSGVWKLRNSKGEALSDGRRILATLNLNDPMNKDLKLMLQRRRMQLASTIHNDEPCPNIMYMDKKPRGDSDKKHQFSLLPDYISKHFYLVASQVPEWALMPKNEHPTLHEIKSLSLRIREDLGQSENERMLAGGHSSAVMMKRYSDERDGKNDYEEISGIKII